MSIQSKLHVDGNVYIVKKFKYGIVQQTGVDGIPSTRPQQTGIRLTVDLVKDELFDEWSIAEKMTKQIEIHMEHTILGQGRTRVLKCYDCYLLGFETDYVAYSNESATYNLYITAGGIEPSWSTGVYSENWRKTFPNEEAPMVVEEEVEGSVLEVYYENKSGDVISRIRKNKEIYLVVKTENMVGKTIDIDLADDAFNFEHKGEILADDQLIDYKVTSDVVRIPLKTIKQS